MKRLFIDGIDGAGGGGGGGGWVGGYKSKAPEAWDNMMINSPEGKTLSAQSFLDVKKYN